MNLNHFWDDEKFIFSNPYFLLAPNPLSFFEFNSPFFKSWPLGYAFLWAVLKTIPGLHFIFFKVFNIVIHSLNAFLFLKILKKLDVKLAIPLSIIFLVHPQNVETVSWFFQIFILLATSFSLLTVWFYLTYLEKGKYLIIILSLLSFAASLLIKPIAVLLPLFAILTFSKESKILSKKVLILFVFLSFSFVASLLTKNGNYVQLQNAKMQIKGISENTHLKRINSQKDTEFIDNSSTFVQSYHAIDKKTLDANSSKIVLKPNEIFSQAFYYYNTRIFFPFDLLFNYPKEMPNIIKIVFAFLLIFSISSFLFFKTRSLRQAIIYPLFFISFMSPYLGFQYIPFFYWSNVSDRYAYLFLFLLPIVIYLVGSALSLKEESFKKAIWSIIFIFTISNFNYGLLFNSPIELYEKIKNQNPNPEIYALLYEEQMKKNLFEDASVTIKDAKLNYPSSAVINDLILRHEILKNNYQN